jgi:thiosulfate/3-mercaptopyruvate sulfurtransferase
MIAAMSGLARREHLATTDWLAERLGRTDVRVVDARWRPDGHAVDVFRAGHVPGSAHVDWRVDLADDDEESGSIRMAAPDRIAAFAERAGIGDGSEVVVYDDTQGLYAARVWWTLRAHGVDRVRVLDGGLPAWIAEGRPVSTAATSTALQDTLPTSFTVRGPDRTVLTTGDIQGLLGTPRVTFLDARAPAEYRGFEGNTRRLGHIPGAINVPVGAMHTVGSHHLRDDDALRSRLHAANVSRGDRMVTYDGSGVAAARLAFILTLLGHEDVAVYDGGWAEWGNRLDLPVDR